MRTRVRTWIAAIAASVALVLAGCAPQPGFDRGDEPSERRIPSADAFDPGFIVSDDAFFDGRAMDEGEIQEFLEARDCRAVDDVPCLADHVEPVAPVPAVGPRHCKAVEGGDAVPASRIIAAVAEACGVSPRVLLVLLQKEQSLLTRPSAFGYERATGYACPDDADCDARYFGFFNQVYRAGWQFRQYTAEPDRQWHRWFGDPQAERLPAYFPPCSRLVGGYTCPPAVPPVPDADPRAAG